MEHIFGFSVNYFTNYSCRFSIFLLKSNETYTVYFSVWPARVAAVRLTQHSKQNYISHFLTTNCLLAMCHIFDCMLKFCTSLKEYKHAHSIILRSNWKTFESTFCLECAASLKVWRTGSYFCCFGHNSYRWWCRTCEPDLKSCNQMLSWLMEIMSKTEKMRCERRKQKNIHPSRISCSNIHQTLQWVIYDV